VLTAENSKSHFYITVVAVFIDLALAIAADRCLRRGRTGVGQRNLLGRAGSEES
jgi:hypothetical protein